MSQKLILPFTSCGVVAGYKTAGYKSGWGYDHYGCDYRSNVAAGGAVLASGEGRVVTAGFDNRVGNTVCVIYKDVYNHKTGKACDLVARYMHLASISVKAGDIVKAGDKLGVEGKTGSGNWDIHLHVEFDTDTAWPNYSPQVAGSNIIKKSPVGYPDTTVNPSHLFYCGDGQVIGNKGQSGWTSEGDWKLPVAPKENITGSDYQKVVDERNALREALDAAEARCDGLLGGMEALMKKYA